MIYLITGVSSSVGEWFRSTSVGVAGRAVVEYLRFDVWAGVVPGVAFTAAAAAHAGLAPGPFVLALLGSTLYFLLYLGVHVLVSQYVSVEEDRINKPTRPLVSVLVSPNVARLARDLILVAFPLLGWVLGVAVWALMWQTLVMMYTHLKVFRDQWWVKLCYNGVGAIPQLCAGWAMVAPLSPQVWHWIIMVAVTVTLTAQVQDLRDVAGDRATGRRTFPIVFGQTATRVSVLVTAGIVIPVVNYILIMPTSWLGWAAWIVPSALAMVTALRVIAYRSQEGDHRTYRTYEQWYAALQMAATVAPL